MQSGLPPTTVITKEQWESRMSQIQPSRDVLNKVVLNYLIVEGYKDAAVKFKKESGFQGKKKRWWG